MKEGNLMWNEYRYSSSCSG